MPRNELIDLVSAVSAAVSATAALVSIIFAYRTIISGQKQKEGDLFLQFRSRYNSEKMKTALREIASIYSEIESFADEWYLKLKAGDIRAEELDEYRRYVKGYFLDAIRLHKAGYISRKLIDALLDQAGLNVFNRVICPMEQKLSPDNWPKQDFDNIARIRKFHGSGAILDPRVR